MAAQDRPGRLRSADGAAKTNSKMLARVAQEWRAQAANEFATAQAEHERVLPAPANRLEGVGVRALCRDGSTASSSPPAAATTS